MHVYFVLAYHKRLSFIKVGVARRPEERMEALRTACPLPLTMLSCIRCNSEKHAYSLERRIHGRFRKYRSQGEWFYYAPEIREWLARSKGHQVCQEDPVQNALDAEYAAIIG